MSDATDGMVIDHAFSALASGDLDGARACFTADALVWHGFDGVARDVDATMQDWAGLVAAFEERFITDVRRQPTPDGFVQQHLFVMRPNGGARRAWPVCIVVRVVDGRIARLDEYIDRAGSFAPTAELLLTPGF